MSDEGRGEWFVGAPDEGEVKSYVGCEAVAKQVLLRAIGFSDATFDAVAIHGVAQSPLRHTEQHLHRGLFRGWLHAPIGHSQREE